MKKNLAKRIVLGLLTGAVLMSNSVAWADGELVGDYYKVYIKDGYDNSLYVGSGPGGIEGHRDNIVGEASGVKGNDGAVLGYNANVGGSLAVNYGVALGNNTRVLANNSVALGYGSYVDTDEINVVSVGSGDTTINGAPATRKIINVTAGENATDAATYGQVQAVENIVGTGIVSSKDSNDDYYVGSTKMNYFRFSNGDNLTEAVQSMASFLDPVVGKVYNDFYTEDEVDQNFLSKTDADFKYLTQEKADGRYVQISSNAAGTNQPQISVDANGQMVFGTTSSWIDGKGEGFFAGRIDPSEAHTAANSQASITSDGSIKGASGKFIVDGNTGNVTAEKITAKEVTAENLYTKEQVNELIGGSNASVAGLNQRLEKTNAKINKVGAGAAALAALHPLDYDPDDKLTFSAGMGNYAGENAAALGAFYRPNEKFMLSLGGTMGNGENMVNLGLSIGLDKASGFAKMSKRELIQEVNAVKAENEAMKDQLANADERIAKLEALVAQLVAK